VRLVRAAPISTGALRCGEAMGCGVPDHR